MDGLEKKCSQTKNNSDFKYLQIIENILAIISSVINCALIYITSITVTKVYRFIYEMNTMAS